ncbi:matrixin family metalloprotease [Kocuria arenosa]|uniref:matrixin family metalloprotease n=1 Tax=Kocuria arenosa TaxID=3071446 RepID=UPI0034D75DED
MTNESPRRRTLSLETISQTPVVQVGEQNAGVEEVQRYLRTFGYISSTEFTAALLDDPTSAALRKYQERNGLEPTGIFDEQTRDAMLQPRCAMPDMLNGVAFSTTCMWNRRKLTYAFDTSTSDITAQGEFAAVRAAFATWAAVVPLQFTEVTTADSPDIRIGWRLATDPDLSMVGRALAHADFPPGCSVVTNTLPKPVHFDDSEHTWALRAQASAFDVETVALHEIGHILGLQHSTVPGAVMWPSVSENFTLRALADDDREGISSLYETPWQHIGHANGVVAMAGLNGKLYCATNDNKLHMRDPVAWDVDWTHIGHANGVVAMAGLNGKLYCATNDDKLHMRDPVAWDVDWTHIGHANGVVAMAGLNGKLYCATHDDNLHMRDPVPWDVDWTHIGHANGVVAMAGLNGKLYCATNDNNLHMRDPVPWDVDWTHIGHANGVVVAVAGLNGSLYGVTNDNKLWMREPIPWEVNWTHIGHANGVVAMDAVNGSLFCATNDNRLWMRPAGL